ncbi:thiolase family protein [Variovorax sp. 770b2]|uniref:thiolase family protein n=1 Tax=Variovorax sp. 770b2 TaxID=1566271 RepID=UPI0008E8C304|nr:thiolase family protein [Variovorax sp. 770b2]SFQ40592.1 Acetyl-CoA acetyltransferase [Variovorax sp. 770b2]
MENTYIVGAGMTPFGKLLSLSVKDLTHQAVEGALSDAGIGKEAVEGAFFGNVTQGHMEGQQMIRGQIALRAMGIERIPVVNIENACATSSTALNLAAAFVQSGQGDVALAIGVEKMYSKDRARMLSVFDSGWDISEVEESKKRLLQFDQGMEIPEGSTSSQPYSVFLDIYGASAREHMKRYGTTQRQVAAVAAKNHVHSQHNERAQYREAMTIEQVLGAPPITYPLTMPMCSPISDGAAAVVVCNEAGLKKLGINRSRAIRILASIIQTGSDRDHSDRAGACTTLAARRAYERAGIAPSDVSVAEVHDATAFGEIVQTENLGFCAFGDGGRIAEHGDTAIGGRIPVNPSGGLESKGHPIGATGLGQVFELVAQLRGEAGKRQVEGARIALSENGGGLIGLEEAVACVTILGR